MTLTFVSLQGVRMQAIILAGGIGTRLKPYTLVFPKPMLPVGGKPIIETIINQLAYYGFDKITISLGYLGYYIKMYFEDNSKIPSGVKISYIDEKKPLGTAGSIGLIEELDDDFLVINGDILTTMNYRDFFKFHVHCDATLSIAAGIKEVKINLGVLEFDESYKITNFIEKPTYKFNDNMGIYIYQKSVLKYIEKNKRLDLNDLVLKLISHGEIVYGYPFKETYFWIDIGEHAEYERANEEFERRREDFLNT